MSGIVVVTAMTFMAITFVAVFNLRQPIPVAADTDENRPGLTWDFTRGSDMTAVGWPADVRGHLWRADNPTAITLITPDGQRGQFDAHSFQVRREGDRIHSILISMQNEESPAAYARAKSLAEEWGVMTPSGSSSAREAKRRLDQWYAGFKPGGSGKGVRMCELIRNDLWPSRTVSIRSSYDENAPWFVGIGFGGLGRPAATKSSTRQAE
ncbi:MAG: hypothetical protein WBD40_03425 [Tepidisphaeraceae bacterium]